MSAAKPGTEDTDKRERAYVLTAAIVVAVTVVVLHEISPINILAGVMYVALVAFTFYVLDRYALIHRRLNLLTQYEHWGQTLLILAIIFSAAALIVKLTT